MNGSFAYGLIVNNRPYISLLYIAFHISDTRYPVAMDTKNTEKTSGTALHAKIL